MGLVSNKGESWRGFVTRLGTKVEVLTKKRVLAMATARRTEGKNGERDGEICTCNTFQGM